MTKQPKDQDQDFEKRVSRTTHSLTAALDRLTVVAISTTNGPGL